MSVLEEKIAKIRNWLTDKNKSVTDFTDECDIIANGMLDSLLFMEFIYVIEEASGSEIDISHLEFEDFSTINKIKTKFLSHL